MIYIIPKSLAKGIRKPKHVEHLTYSEMKAKEFKNDDVIVSNLDSVVKYSNSKKINCVFLLKRNYRPNSKKELFKFFITEKSLLPLCDALSKRTINQFKVENRDSVINFIFDKKYKKTLLLHRKKPFWGYEPVKGGIDKGESQKDAVIRETYEECGLKISDILYTAPKPIVYNNINLETGKIRHTTAYVFVSVANTNSRTSINEKDAKRAFTDSKWFDIKTAKFKFVLPRYQLAFEYALK